MTLYLGNNLISGVAYQTEPTRNLGQIIESIVPLTDAGLHLLDGTLILGGGIYSEFVTYISGLVSAYPDLFVTEADWQTSVNTYGVCGKFVYDSLANTVRLPKVTGIIEGTTDVTALGDLVEAGLPNLTGYLRGVGLANNGNDGFSDGKLFSGPQSNEYTRNGGSVYTGSRSNFDASNYNSIYGNSNTVQPQTIKCYYYIVIATTTKTEIEVDIDEVVTDLNGKMDTDLNNMSASQSAKNEIISWVMPDYTNGITLSSLPYTVPTDGYIDIAIAALNGTQELFNNNIKIGHAYSSGNSFYSMISGQYKVKQGDVIRSTSNSIQWGAFYPLKGAN